MKIKEFEKLTLEITGREAKDIFDYDNDYNPTIYRLFHNAYYGCDEQIYNIANLKYLNEKFPKFKDTLFSDETYSDIIFFEELDAAEEEVKELLQEVKDYLEYPILNDFYYDEIYEEVYQEAYEEAKEYLIEEFDETLKKNGYDFEKEGTDIEVLYHDALTQEVFEEENEGYYKFYLYWNSNNLNDFIKNLKKVGN